MKPTCSKHIKREVCSVEAWMVKKTMRYYGNNGKKNTIFLLTYCGAPRGPSGADFAPDGFEVGLGHLT